MNLFPFHESPPVPANATSLPPALLTMPEYCGTLAATRCLGSLGVEIWSAGSDRSAPGTYSRFVKRKLRAPSTDVPGSLLQWLLSEGKQNPGSVLYPTSDDFAWFQAVHADALRPYFRLYAPEANVLEKLLDKKTLHHLCASVGIETPRSYFPESEADIDGLGAELTFPLLLKQRTQILSTTHSKGRVVSEQNQLVPHYRHFVSENAHDPTLLARMPNASRPMLQAYHSEGVTGSYLLSGFIDRTGQHLAARAANKVLQRPRTLGIALCLEVAPVDETLLEKIAHLCRSIGYFGVFQIELLRVQNRYLLIDFNPRYYHYMAFDIARGLELPFWAHLGACGKDGELASALDAARMCTRNEISAFTYRLQLYELLVAQTLAGTMSPEESIRWKRWCDSNRLGLVDAVDDKVDRMPSLVDAARHVVHRIGHPRSFIRQIALDQ